MLTFKEFRNQLIMEVPQRIGRMDTFIYTDFKANRHLYEIAKNLQHSIIKNIKPGVDLIQVNNDVYCTDDNLLQITYVLGFDEQTIEELKGKVISQAIVWSNQNVEYTKNLPTEMFWNFLFNKTNCIMTDKQQSDKGERFWCAQIKTAFIKKLNVYKFNSNTKSLYSYNDVDEVLGDKDFVYSKNESTRENKLVITSRKLT
jgi:hypothetical protein